MKFVDDDKVTELYGDSWIHVVDNTEGAPGLEVQLPKTGDANIQGFEAPTEYLHLYFDQYVSPIVLGIMKKMGFFLGLGLGKKHQGLAEVPHFVSQKNQFGLGYEFVREEKKKEGKERKGLKG